MDLLLEIVSHQRHAMAEEQLQFVFKTAGGTIGRNQNNDWLIDDPERLISGRHASILFENNQFHITDNSTNGLFVNQEQQALGEQYHIISNGDIFLLGQYSLQATLISTQSKAVFSASNHQIPSNSSLQNETVFPDLLNNSARSLPLNTSVSNEASIPLFPHELPQNSSQYIDPLSQFENNSIPGRSLEQDILFEADPVNSVLDPILSTQSYFDLPNAIPENWLKIQSENSLVNNTDNSLNNSLNKVSTKTVTSHLSQEPIENHDSILKTKEKVHLQDMNNDSNNNKNTVGNFEDFKNDFNLVDINHEPGKKESKQSDTLLSHDDHVLDSDLTSQLHKTQIHTKGHTQNISNSLSNNISNKVKASHVQSQIPEIHSSANTHSEAIKVLLENLGINPQDVSDEQLPELTKNIALITKNSMSGIMKTMLSRAHLKNEFRMSMTTIQTHENNPLKFCINYEQLVHYLLVKPMSGYLDSEQAVKESFDELQEHQVGVMAGMKSALKYMLEKLSPEKIIEKSNRSKFKSLGLSSKKSRYWDMYNELYNDINEEDGAFTSLFGNEFCKAYERQIEDIRQARK